MFSKFDELIDDRLYRTVLKAGEGGQALKNRLEGDAEMYKELLNRESLRADDEVKYFRDTFGPRFIKGPQSAFLLSFFNDFLTKKRKHSDGQVDRQVHSAP